ncbi:cardiolipin synthase [Bacillus aquiflavi]|uniref:Cardiolipin synthase n=1 Tax=Bacillus aquiflavi TaxID=2672567 RepID=A0A6B3VXE6_9BACI|nr:cardiolipin synthase [Bacillus aquiflavi]MBA4536599.1 cardiolipin synthase [Bacillus aquiflavi]NEY80967.1 cardiolipin synthase [Bacillus aquiflavi]UAC47955.1 cardiolipin synthase [Bacillus aquiflavi]
MKILFTMIIILTIFTLWLSIDYYLGRKKHLASGLKKEFPIRQSDIYLYTDGIELFKDLFHELKNAKNHIHILFYIVKNDHISNEFLNILKTKALAGIEVRLLLDWLGSIKVSREKIYELRNAGVRFSFCHVPKAPFFFYTMHQRNHRKITVIDGKVGYIGGYNIGKEYINEDPKLNPWRDYHLKIYGEGVHDLQKQFMNDWIRATKSKISDTKSYFPYLNIGETKHQFISSEGIFLEHTYSELIKKAKKSIFIGSPYFIPSKRILAHLINALNNGINVTILVPYQSDHIIVKDASLSYFRELLKNGAKIFQYSHGFYHAKVMLIDSQVCNIGTANFDKRSFYLNDEINCYIFSQDFIKKVEEVIQKDIRESKALTIEELKQTNVFQTFKEAFASAISHFL